MVGVVFMGDFSPQILTRNKNLTPHESLIDDRRQITDAFVVSDYELMSLYFHYFFPTSFCDSWFPLSFRSSHISIHSYYTYIECIGR